MTAILAVFASAVGLFTGGGGGPFTFVNIHGHTVQMYGSGLYQNDSLMTGAGLRGADAVTLFIFIPLLVWAIYLTGRNSLRGKLLLVCGLTYFLYNSLSMAFSATYNSMFLVYIAMLTTSLFGLILAYLAIDYTSLLQATRQGFPFMGISRFLFISGVILFLMWASDVFINLIQQTIPPLVMSYTTIVTYVLDLGIIVPSVLLGGFLVARRDPIGIPLSASMLFLCAAIGISIIAQTISQILAGMHYTPAQFILFIFSFIIMSCFAIWFLTKGLRHITPEKQPAAPIPG
jgi:hypothetical protein